MMADQVRVWETLPAPWRTCEARDCDRTAYYVVEEWAYGADEHDRGYYCQPCVPGQVALRLT